SIDDLALIAEQLMAFDGRDSSMRLRPRPRLRATASSEPPVDPRFIFVRSPVWNQANADCQEAFSELVEFLGEGCDEVELPQPFNEAVRWHRTIMYADLAKSFSNLYHTGKDQLTATLRDMIEEGQTTLAVDYNRALDMASVLYAGLERVFDRYDAIITPATTGEAPVGLDSTGSPVFCTLWTYLGVPAVTLPLLRGQSGMPIGVQVVGLRNDDARLLRTARWLADKVASDDQ
ncbi:MAG TPA: amidase family protein, partial [Gammaproteobacteria bacterium]